jgi:hypothetical protein
VLSLGAVALWLSIQPSPDRRHETATGTAGESSTPQPTPEDRAKTKGFAKTTESRAQLTQSDAPAPEKDPGFRPITPIQPELARPQGDTRSTLAQSSAPGSSQEDLLPPGATRRGPSGGDATTASVVDSAGTQAVPPAPGESRAVERPLATPEPMAKSIEPPETRVGPEQRSQIDTAQPAPESVVTPVAPVPEKRTRPPRPRQRPPAPPGRYETITTATARARPDDTSPIEAEIRRGTILNVTGSYRDWLIVYSKRKNITVYVKRDEAMLSNRKPLPSTDVPESEWPRVEQAIRQAFVRNNVAGVQATFIGDTAYLKGTVKTDREREKAEIFARSVLEVKHVFNGIRVE